MGGRIDARKLSVTAARSRVHATRPKASSLLCMDCGKQAREYDHPEGYGVNWDNVEPVCRSCHLKREYKRGIRGVKGRKVLIGPRMERGYFFTYAYPKTVKRRTAPRCQ